MSKPGAADPRPDAAESIEARWPFQRILGIKFFDGPVEAAVDTMIRDGGLLVVPAAPALANVQYDETYRDALVRADVAIADSGFMVLLWRILKGRRLARISGLAYLKRLLDSPQVRAPGSVFLVLPSESAKAKAIAWASTQGFQIGVDDCYVAPRYGSCVEDPHLRDMLNVRRPIHVLIGLSGGVQEKLGLGLRDSLDYRPAIHCIGAALGFLTGDQKPMPDWADRFYLGWLLRLARNPRLYLRRFWIAHELPQLIRKYGERLPPLKARGRESKS